MFFVLNKEKMKSYLVSLSTVAILLLLSVALQNNISNKVVSTATNAISTPIVKVETDEKVVALSINCVKNMDNIDNILDTLSKTNSKATFFVTGDIVEKYPKEIQKIINNGNEIGNLSNKYTSLKQMSKEDIKTQMQECNKKIENVTSNVPKLFRSPYGECNAIILQEAKENNMEVVGWNIDSLDYNGLTDEEINDRINENLSAGSIILMHNEYLKDNLESVINNIEKSGYQVTNISKMLV